MTTALLALSLVFQAPPALQGRAQLTPELVCAVQHSLKWRRAAWPKHRCRRVAELTNRTDSPEEMLAIQVLESGMDFTGIAWHRGHTVADVGMCGVRCLLGPDRRCTNWPVKGLTVRRLLRPAVNIRAAARILARKRHTCGEKAHDCYLGNPSGSRGRTQDVRAIVAAFRGELVEAATKRAAALAKRIAAAVNRGRES